MSRKSEKIAARIKAFGGGELSPYYLGYFDCFNRQEFYEAHDVLEEMWLPQRKAADGDFYKGLIQLAGAFVHLQKNRLGPAVALFNLAQANLAKYPADHHQLSVTGAIELIGAWRARLQQEPARNPLQPGAAPVLTLLSAGD